MKEKVVLIGAGSAMFTRGLVADFIRRNEPMELALVDIRREALDAVRRLSKKMITARRAPIQLSASTDRRDVLKGATAVICTVGVGGRRAWEQDVYIPRKYGIYQPVGDSVMPGGTSRALRMIPAMVAIANDVLDLAPGALFFNYGNPMGPVCRALRKATAVPVVGLCHGVFHVGQFLAGVLGVEPSRIRYTAVGMNHLTWFTEIREEGKDLLPRLQEIAREKLAKGIPRKTFGSEFPGRPKRGELALEEANIASWQFLQLFDAFPAVVDRHVVEFFPRLFGGRRAYFGRTLGVDVHTFEPVIAYGDRIYEEMCELASSKKPLPEDFFERIGGEHEQVVEIIECIRRDAGGIYSANLPNRGQIPNFPPDAIVESPVIADGAGVRPIQQRPVSSGIVGTLATRFAWVETVVEAALEGSRQKFIQALLLDGAVDSVETATKLADELLLAHAKYLPQFGRAAKR